MSSSSSAPQPVKLSLPLEYQQSLFQELRADDELVVLARGLGLMRLVTNLLHSYDAAGNNLVLVVNADERENGWIGEALAEHAAISMAARARGLTVVNTDFTTVGAREKMYAVGGIFSITSRILVVDLLTNLLKPETVTGMVVLHAERVVATSLEAFILRIYRQKNKVGFLKAFSDNPESFATGFAPLATMMRNLFLRKASLWPRFHVTVASALEGKKRAEVVEFEVPMTDSMRTIQNAILECVEVNIHELKRTNSGLLDMEDWNLDSALLKNFDVIVRRQLDPHWHRLSWKTKQIVGDLSVLRGLLQSIVECDAVSFLQRLDTILAAHAPPPGSTRHTQPPWLFLDAAQTIFDTAKRRVYTGKHNLNTDDDEVLRPGANANKPAHSSTLHPVLEEQPKWTILADILEEIDRDLYLESQPRDDSNGTILIMCADTDTCRQLRDFLQVMHMRPRTETRVEEFFDADADRPSGAFMMRRKLRNYLRWKREFANVNASLFQENQKALNGAIDPRTGRPAGAMRNGVPLNKRRRIRGGGGGMAQATNASALATALAGDGYGGRTANGSVAQYFEKPNEVAELMAEIQAADGASSTRGAGDGDGAGEGATSSDDAEMAAAQQKADILAALADPLEDMDDYYELYEMRDLVVVHAYDGDQDEHVLEEVKPRYIVMYEPDAAFIRRIEVYRSSHNDRGVRTYFMYYGGSVEEQKYLSAVRREKDAFTRLIKERASMAVTLTATTAAHGGISNADDPQESFLRTVNTRIAGGGRLAAATAQQPRVVVDVREFRSSLPSLLHGRSMAVVPCMLTVGDYVLSNNICVERKSVSDLISSFRDGRLFAQCESMFQHYASPMLLIEFDQNKAFTLEPFADLSSSSSSAAAASTNPNTPDLQSKIVLLTLAFPKLRILWASSPYETAEIFERLKSQETEPDPVAAVRAGLDPSARADDQPFNLEPQEMLAAVPGVTPQNLRTLVCETESISAIATMEVSDLEPIVGGESARLITKFFKRDVIEDVEET